MTGHKKKVTMLQYKVVTVSACDGKAKRAVAWKRSEIVIIAKKSG